MKYEDLIEMYNERQLVEGDEAYRSIPQLLRDVKEFHKQDFLRRNPDGDSEQSWRAFKGKNFEKLIEYIIEDLVKKLGAKVINGNKLKRRKNLSLELSRVKRNTAIDYGGEYGLHLPDADIIVYTPENWRVIALISIKVTLHERIAQIGSWKLKLLEDAATEHIKCYFITPDEDGTLTSRASPKKGRAIVETELDGTYVITEEPLAESANVKLFEHFIEDFKHVIRENI